MVAGFRFWADWGTGEPFKSQLSWVSSEAESYFQKMVEFVRTYKSDAMHWGDFLEVWPVGQPG